MKVQHDQAKSIFLGAVEIASAQERRAFIDARCAGDDALRAEVEEFLAHHQGLGSFLQDAPAGLTSAFGAQVARGTAEDSGPAEGPGAVVGPYKLLELIGEGGMGLVFMAEQQQPVRRKVALKLIKPGMDSRQVIARFEAERQALALMDHPNIARVLDAGETASGRPHFVMELVRGVPITDYCDQNRLTTRERLELFAHVCQAVQHAHHKGIIHRDIKPSNVMVTLHNEVAVVKVIDFGIAKALGQQLTDKTLVTGFAQLIGTPLYMSPEQAQLSGLDVDTRSDIYSLGVLLYELLTGTTPFDGERLRAAGYDEMRRIIREEESPRPSTRLSTLGLAAATVAERRRSDPRRLSQLLCGELDWILMKALEKDRSRRYESASAFAADVERHLRDEAVLACPPSAWYRFGKFARRNKVALRTAAAAALVLLLAAGGSGWTLWDQATRQAELSQRTAETERSVNAALVAVERLRDQARKMPRRTSEEADAILVVWQQAEAALAPALAALKTGTANDLLRQQVLDVRQQIGQRRAQARRTANLLRDLDDAHMTRLTWIENHFDNAGAATQYAAAFAAYGLEVKPGRTEGLARRIRAEESGIREALIVALEDWLQTTPWAKTAGLANLLRAVAAAADDDPWRRQYRAAAIARNATGLRALSAQARRLSLPPSSLVLLGRGLRAQGDRDEALALLRWVRGRHLTDFWVHFELASVLQQGKDKSPVIVEETIGCYRTALALRPASSAAHNNLGSCLVVERNQLDEALLFFSKAVELDPKHVPAWNNRGAAYFYLKQWDKALADLTKAIDLDPKWAPAHVNLGNVLRAMNLLDEASVEYRKAIEFNPKLATAHNNLGLALAAKNQWDEAIAEYHQAIKLDPKLAEAHANLGNALKTKSLLDEAVAEYRQAIKLDPKDAKAHISLGFVLAAKNQLDEAIAEYREAIKLDPKDAWGHNNFGLALMAKKQWDEAIAEYRQAIKLDPGFAMAHSNLGLVLAAKNQLDEAIAEYCQAIKIDPKFAMVHNNLGITLAGKKRWDEAIAEYCQAIKLDPKLAMAHSNLGLALAAKNRWDEAIAEYHQAIKLDPKLAEAYTNLGMALVAKNQLDEAIAEYKKAIEINPQLVSARNNLGNALRAKMQLDEALGEYRKAFDLDPKNARTCHNLALVLAAKNQWDEAIAEYKKAINIDPNSALIHNNLGLALAAKNQWDEAITEYKNAIKLDKKFAIAHNNLGIALQAKKLFDEAIAEYRHAIKLNLKLAGIYVNMGNALSAKERWDEAIAEYKKAIDIDPKLVQAHGALGYTFLSRGRFAEALMSTKNGLDLLPAKHPLRSIFLRQRSQCDAFLVLEAKLPDILSGKATPADNRERRGLLEVCRLKRRHAAAAWLYAGAFTADAKLVDDLKAGHRYNAACFAALAAAGQGTDARKLDAQEQSRLRQQALAWLRADLEQWRKRREGGKPADRQVVRATLEHWQRDTDLIGVRDADSLKKLSAEEREAWRKLWADVAELLKKAGNAK